MQSLKTRVRKGIATFQPEKRIILRVLRRFGEISETEFDRIFSDTKKRIRSDGVTVILRRKPRIRFIGCTADSFILGGVMSSGDLWKFIELVGYMAFLGEVSSREMDGLLYYRLPKKG
jgi:hypothetical protein